MPENTEKKIGEAIIKCQPSTIPVTWLPDRGRGGDSRNHWQDRHFYPQDKLIILRHLETGCWDTTFSVGWVSSQWNPICLTWKQAGWWRYQLVKTQKLRKKNSPRSGRLHLQQPQRKRTPGGGGREQKEWVDNKQRVQEAEVYETKVYFGGKDHTQKSVILLIWWEKIWDFLKSGLFIIIIIIIITSLFWDYNAGKIM